jgi:hypothetical protein
LSYHIKSLDHLNEFLSNVGPCLVGLSLSSWWIGILYSNENPRRLHGKSLQLSLLGRCILSRNQQYFHVEREKWKETKGIVCLRRWWWTNFTTLDVCVVKWHWNVVQYLISVDGIYSPPFTNLKPRIISKVIVFSIIMG